MTIDKRFYKGKKEEENEQKEEIIVPTQRARRNDDAVIFFKPNIHSFGLKVAIRNIAKTLPEYHLPIEFKNGEARFGSRDTGDFIPINTVGRWIFGVPGYMGHAIFEGGEQKRIAIWLPINTPDIIKELLAKACELL